jgi:tetratricopeptide (TPR) repeat protein
VETDAQKSQMIAAQGMMAVLGRQNERAIALLSEALAIEETDDALDARATLYLQTRDYEKAASDLERAYDLSGDLDAAIAYARALVLAGQGAEALELLDTLALGGAEGRRVTRQWAYASGAAGQLEEGWLRLDDALLEEPDDRRLLNAQCWFMGIWSYDLENAMSICEEAVSQGNTSASSLDSRALVKYRLGDFEGAMADYNLALEKSPAMSGSLYMRGVIKHAMGDDSWQLDITHALRMDGYRADQFAIYGIEAPR